MEVAPGNAVDAWGFPLAQRHFGLSGHRVADRGSAHSPGLFFDVERLGSQRPDHDSVGDAPIMARYTSGNPMPGRLGRGKAALHQAELWDQRSEFEDHALTGFTVDPRTGETLEVYERAAPDADNRYGSLEGRQRKYAQLQGPFSQFAPNTHEYTTEEFHGPAELREDFPGVANFVRAQQVKRAKIAAFHAPKDDESAWYDPSGNDHIEDLAPATPWPAPRHPAMPALHVPGGKTQNRVSSRAMHVEGGDAVRGSGPREAPPQRRETMNRRIGIVDTRETDPTVFRPDATERQGRFEGHISRRLATMETREEAPPLVRPSAAETLSKYAEVIHRRAQRAENLMDPLAVRPDEVPTMVRPEGRPQRVRAAVGHFEAGPGRDFIPEPSMAARRDDLRRPHTRATVDREPAGAGAPHLYLREGIEVGAVGAGNFRNTPARLRPRIGALADLLEGGAPAPRAEGEKPVLVDEGLFTRRRFHAQSMADAVAFAGDASERQGRYHELRARVAAPEALQDQAGRGPTGEIAHSAYDNLVDPLKFRARPTTPSRYLRTAGVMRNERVSRESTVVDSNFE